MVYLVISIIYSHFVETTLFSFYIYILAPNCFFSTSSNGDNTQKGTFDYTANIYNSPGRAKKTK